MYVVQRARGSVPLEPLDAVRADEAVKGGVTGVTSLRTRLRLVVLLFGLLVLPREVRLKPGDLRAKGRSDGRADWCWCCECCACCATDDGLREWCGLGCVDGRGDGGGIGKEVHAKMR